MTGAAITILARHAAELGHGENHDIVHLVTEVGDERGDRTREIVEPLRELTRRRSLIHVRIPAADIGKRDLESDIGLDQLRDLEQTQSKLRDRKSTRLNSSHT